MDREGLGVVGRLGMAGLVCAGLLVGSACGREAASGASAVVGPGAVAAVDEAGSGVADGGVAALSNRPTPAELVESGWSCRLSPVGTTACSPPGRGLPVIPAPEDRPPSYHLSLFDTPTGRYLGFVDMIRTDLYAGQVCAATGATYNYSPLIGYYECTNLAG
jgi:hypothetical protein